MGKNKEKENKTDPADMKSFANDEIDATIPVGSDVNSIPQDITDSGEPGEKLPPLNPESVMGDLVADGFPSMKDLVGKYIALHPSTSKPFWGLRAKEMLLVSITQPVMQIPFDLTEDEYRMIKTAMTVENSIMIVDSSDYQPFKEDAPIQVDLTFSQDVSDAFLMYDSIGERFDVLVNGCPKIAVLQKLIEIETAKPRSGSETRLARVKARIDYIEKIHMSKAIGK